MVEREKREPLIFPSSQILDPIIQVEDEPSSYATTLPPPQQPLSYSFCQGLRNQFDNYVTSSPLHQYMQASPSHNPHISAERKLTLHRSRTAPAMAVLSELESDDATPPPSERASSIIRQAGFFLLLYLILGVIVYTFNRDHFSGIETHPVVDALYFCIVTMCTIGYGDITPLTPATKLFACIFVLIGFGFIDILLSGVVNYVLDLQESLILSGIRANEPHQRTNFIVDVRKGRMRIRLKVGLALGVVSLCIGMGVLVLYFVEHLDWIDSVYLSVLSVTTVGYGDRAFKTLPGRLFAAIWLLFSTLAVARAFLYLVEARIDKRQRRIAKWVLQREITVEDLLAASINNHDFMRKSEYVIYKLKEMGKIVEKDILQICNQFGKLDGHNLGKITLHDLLKNNCDR